MRCLRLRLDQLQHRHDVLLDRQPAEDRGFLRQVADAEARAPVHGQPRHVAAVERDLAGVRRHQAGDHVEHGGLAGAVGTEQAHRLAAPGGQADALHHHAAAVALLHVDGGQPALAAVGHRRLLAMAGVAVGPALRPLRGRPLAAALRALLPNGNSLHGAQLLRMHRAGAGARLPALARLGCRLAAGEQLLDGVLGLVLRFLGIEQQALLARRTGAARRDRPTRSGRGRQRRRGAGGRRPVAPAASCSSSKRYMPRGEVDLQARSFRHVLAARDDHVVAQQHGVGPEPDD